MLRKPATIISDSARAPACVQAGDWHDVSGHHRYYGSSACNGGERIVENRRGPRPRSVNRLRLLIAEASPGDRNAQRIQKKRDGIAPVAPQLLYSLVQG